jgi:hypothetical protein
MIKYLTIAAVLFVSACASKVEQIESEIETFSMISGSYCRDGNIPKWFHNGENYYFLTCHDGQTFSIKKN